MRNVEKQINKGNMILESNKHLDLYLSEVAVLFERFQEKERSEGRATAILDTIGAAYSFGIAVGMRNNCIRGK